MIERRLSARTSFHRELRLINPLQRIDSERLLVAILQKTRLRIVTEAVQFVRDPDAVPQSHHQRHARLTLCVSGTALRALDRFCRGTKLCTRRSLVAHGPRVTRRTNLQASVAKRAHVPVADRLRQLRAEQADGFAFRRGRDSGRMFDDALQIGFGQRRRIRSRLRRGYPRRRLDELHAFLAQTRGVRVVAAVTLNRVLAPRPFAERDPDIAALMWFLDDEILDTRRAMPLSLTSLWSAHPLHARRIQLLPERAVRRDRIHFPMKRAARARFVEQIDETLAELTQAVLALRERHARDALVVEWSERWRVEGFWHHRVARRIDRQPLKLANVATIVASRHFYSSIN